MTEYFADIKEIPFLGPDSEQDLSFRYYDPKRLVLGKSMVDILRPAVCFWHSFCWQGSDIFGFNTKNNPWQTSEEKINAGVEFVSKLNVPFLTFHDRDIASEGNSLKETESNLQYAAEHLSNQMTSKGLKLLWGTANLFSNPLYMAGAATNPDPEIFAMACAQVKLALETTHQLNGANYVLWGGREGYDTLLNTNLRQESDQLARFLSLLVDYKHKINFKGTLLIEPKPCEPCKHQYDYDTAHVYAFLQRYGLEKEFKVNIEANHATLAGHSFSHEVAYAFANDLFGSIDANQGDPQLGWDTDQFPTDLHETTMAMYFILKHGGFTTGGFNFDSKLRRQSIQPEDLFYGHISGLDTLARCLLIAEKLITKETLEQPLKIRYQGWQGSLGQAIMKEEHDLASIAQMAHDKNHQNLKIKQKSGSQEKLEHLVNCAIF